MALTILKSDSEPLFATRVKQPCSQPLDNVLVRYARLHHIFTPIIYKAAMARAHNLFSTRFKLRTVQAWSFELDLGHLPNIIPDHYAVGRVSFTSIYHSTPAT